jgi:glucose-1-phosphate thymidylyltransferase
VVLVQLLPLYDKPMIYYPLSVLMLSGIKDILIISTPQDINLYKELLGDGKQIGLKFNYAVQDKPRGLADAFIDNIFYGQEFIEKLRRAVNRDEGATIFGYYVKDPTQFGIVEFDEQRNVISLEEKPKYPKSKYAIPGLYFYDNEVISIAKNIKPSDRGELEITAVNNEYLKKGKLKVELLGRGIAWLDTGTCSGLLKAGNFVETIQTRQGLYLACIEEIAYRKGYIDKEQLLKLAEPLKKTDYGRYLISIAEEVGVI